MINPYNQIDIAKHGLLLKHNSRLGIYGVDGVKYVVGDDGALYQALKTKSQISKQLSSADSWTKVDLIGAQKDFCENIGIVKKGLKLKANGNNLHINITGGSVQIFDTAKLKWFSKNFVANSQANFHYADLNGSLGSSTSLVDTTKYFDGNTVKDIPQDSQVTFQKFYVSAEGTFAALYGSKLYDSLDVALRDIQEETIPSLNGFYFIGGLLLSKNTTTVEKAKLVYSNASCSYAIVSGVNLTDILANETEAVDSSVEDKALSVKQSWLNFHPKEGSVDLPFFVKRLTSGEVGNTKIGFQLEQNALHLYSTINNVKSDFYVNHYDSERRGEIQLLDATNSTKLTNKLLFRGDTSNGFLKIVPKDKGDGAGRDIAVMTPNGICKQDGTPFSSIRRLVIFNWQGYARYDRFYAGHADHDGTTAKLQYRAALPTVADELDMHFDFRIQSVNFGVGTQKVHKTKQDELYTTRYAKVPVKGIYKVTLMGSLFRKKVYYNDWNGFGLLHNDSPSNSNGSLDTRIHATNWYKNEIAGKVIETFVGSMLVTLEKDTLLTPAFQSLDAGAVISCNYEIELYKELP